MLVFSFSLHKKQKGGIIVRCSAMEVSLSILKRGELLRLCRRFTKQTFSGGNVIFSNFLRFTKIKRRE
jgi:hypothetical protein